MNKKLLAKIFVLSCYLFTAVAMPFLLLLEAVLWLISVNTEPNKVLLVLNVTSYAILFMAWVLIALGIFGYAVEDD